jgi:hypothetical protein
LTLVGSILVAAGFVSALAVSAAAGKTTARDRRIVPMTLMPILVV